MLKIFVTREYHHKTLEFLNLIQ